MSENAGDEKAREGHKERRRSTVGVDAFEKEDWKQDVGSREHPEDKFLSYTKAKVKEALTKVRHVVPLEGAEADAKTSVGKNGEVIFDGNKYEIVSTCGANTGAPSLNCFKCCKCCKPRPREPSDFEKLGVGVVLYFKYLKIMACAFFFVTVLAVVQFVIFENAGALKGEVEAQGGGFATLSLITMGNLGEGQPLCEKVSEGEKLKLYCDEGQIIGAISKVLYGQPDGTCNCPQAGSEEAYDFGAELPPSLQDPTKCGVDFPYTGVTSITQERCCANEDKPSGAGDLSLLDFVRKKKCESDVRQTKNTTGALESEQKVCAGATITSDESGRSSFAWDIVFNACNGQNKCEIMVDDFTGWNENTGKLESCMEAAASDCLFAFGSQDKLTLERNESTFSNCTNTELKSLAVVASCFDTDTVIMDTKTTKAELWAYLTLTECAQVLVLLFFIWLLQKSQKEDSQVIDENVITLSDYSVEISNLSSLIHDAKYKVENDDGTVTKDNNLIAKDLEKHFETYLSTRPHAGKDEESIEKNKNGIKVHEVNFGKADGAIIHYKVSRGKVIKKLAHLQGEIRKEQESTKKNKDKKLESLNKKKEKLEKQQQKIEEKLAKLNGHKSINDPVKAYVTFTTNQGMIRCIDNYPQQSCAWCCQSCCKGKKALVNEKYRLWLNVAPEAENIWWENLATGSKARAIRRAISTVVTLCLLFASIAGVSVVKGVNARLARLYPPVDCGTLTEKYDGKITKSDVELDELLLGRIETNFTYNTLMNTTTVTVANITQNEYDIGKSSKINIKFVEKVTKDSLLQCYCMERLAEGNDPRKDLFRPLKDIQNISLLNNTAEYIGHVKEDFGEYYDNGQWCIKYTFDFAEIQGLTMGGVLLVIAINVVLKQVMKALVKFEHPQSKSEYSVSLAKKLFIVQLINTAAILLIVNGNLQHMGLNEGLLDGLIFGGDHEDFNSQWYVTVGASLVLTMFINMLTPLYSPVGNWVTRGLKRTADSAKCLMCCGQDRQFSKKLTQAEYESLWSGGDFELPARYGALEMVYWVTLIYGTGLPILYPLALCYFTLAYWIDKWALTKLYDRPIQTDEKVAVSVTENMIYAVLVHLMFATWKYSNSKIFQNVNVIESSIEAAEARGVSPPEDLLAMTDVIQCRTGGGLGYALTRIVLTAPHMFVLTALLITFLTIYRLVLPIFGTLLLTAFPFLETCFSHAEEDTNLTVEEAISKAQLQGAHSYDILANRQYAIAFAAEEEAELKEAVVDTKPSSGGDVEMVVNPLKAYG